MRFHPPLDDAQWTAAAKTHAQMRVNLRQLRRDYPPRSSEETEIIKRYRNIIQEFGRELLKPHGRIDALRLNELNDEAVDAFVVYVRIRGLTDRGD
jgi:hypothetical protein